MRTELRLALGDGGTYYSNSSILRAITTAIVLLSRHYPKKTLVEGRITKTVADEALSISSNTGTLANLPVDYHSETITNAASTTMVRDTNYRINYLTGVVTEISSLLPDGSYTVTYKTDDQLHDFSGVLTTYLRIESLEYPLGVVPYNQPPYEIVNRSYLKLLGEDVWRHNAKYRLWYSGIWDIPGGSGSDYPEHMDEATMLAAQAFLLFERASYFLEQSSTQYSDADTTSASMATPLADINVAADLAVATPITNARSRLTSGLSVINTSNTGKDVAENYNRYANSEIELAKVYLETATRRIQEVSGWLNKVQAETTFGDKYSQLASNYFTLAQYRLVQFFDLLGVKAEIPLGRMMSLQMQADYQ
jgi:hypothetical protein|tara:strand:- start:7891 stop:8985 length:1095 start_codon:yes stop_codon:yes gene_type:complete